MYSGDNAGYDEEQATGAGGIITPCQPIPKLNKYFIVSLLLLLLNSVQSRLEL